MASSVYVSGKDTNLLLQFSKIVCHGVNIIKFPIATCPVRCDVWAGFVKICVQIDEFRDAFYAVAKGVEYAGATAETIELTRPFAQINVATNDRVEFERDGVTLDGATSTLTVTNVADTFYPFSNIAKAENLTDGQTELDVTFTSASIPTEDLKVMIKGEEKEYDYLAMGYVLIPNETGESSSTSVSTISSEITLSGITEKITVSYEGATIQQNRRTNLVGKLLTTSAGYDIVIDNKFITPDNTHEYENVETAEAANAAFASGNTTSVKIETITTDAEIVLPSTNEVTTVLLPETDATVTFSYPDDAEADTPDVLNITAPEGTEIVLNVPETTVYINGVLQTVKSTTANHTLVVTDGTIINNLVVVKGNVRIEKGGIVKAISRDSNNEDEVTTIYLGEDVEQPEGASETGFTVITMGNTWNGSSCYAPEYDQNTKTYKVVNAYELAWIAVHVNAGNNLKGHTVSLENNIDLDNKNWTPIGTPEHPFKGIFNGNGYSIKNLNIVEEEAKEGKAYIGLFGYAEDVTVKNVTFENVYLNIACLDIDHSQGHIGAVAGSLEGTSTIEDVTVKGNVKVEATFDANGASRVAVVAGGNSGGNVTMKNVHVKADENSYLKANNNVGALAGQLQEINVFENCSSNIDVTGKKFFAGGIIGLAAGNSTFTNCHTTGDVKVTAGREGRANDHYRVGGIAGGWADNVSTPCVLINCSYTGNVSGTNADGSIAVPLDYAGYVGRGYTLTNCGGSTVTIDGVSYIQAGDTADCFGKYNVVKDGVYEADDAAE